MAVESERRLSFWFTAKGKVFEVRRFPRKQTVSPGWVGDENGSPREEIETKIQQAQEKRRQTQANLPAEIDASTISDESYYSVILPRLARPER